MFLKHLGLVIPEELKKFFEKLDKRAIEVHLESGMGPGHFEGRVMKSLTSFLGDFKICNLCLGGGGEGDRFSNTICQAFFCQIFCEHISSGVETQTDSPHMYMPY